MRIFNPSFVKSMSIKIIHTNTYIFTDMKIWNELTFAEIAEALGISQNTAASRYRYGLAALKKTYQPQ